MPTLLSRPTRPIRRKPLVTDPLTLLAERAESGGAFSYKYASDAYGLDAPALGREPQFDDRRMSCIYPFAASLGRDRQGDYLDIAGIDTRAHEKYPVAFIDHAKWARWPFGMDENPDTKKYRVWNDEEAGLAWCETFVNQHSADAVMAYKLYRQGVLRTGSIGYRPLEVEVLPPEPDLGQLKKGLWLKRVELLETTLVVGVPANGDVVRRALEMGVEGEPLTAGFKSMLETVAPPRVHQVTSGWWLGKESFFGQCDRDEQGHCKPGTGGGTAAADKPADKKPAGEKKKPARASFEGQRPASRVFGAATLDRLKEEGLIDGPEQALTAAEANDVIAKHAEAKAKKEAGAQAPAKSEKKKYGPSKAKVEFAGHADAEAVKKALGKAFAGLTLRQATQVAASVVGAPDDATVKLFAPKGGFGKGKHVLAVVIDHPDFKRPAIRNIGIKADGTRYIENELIDIKPEKQGQGLGADIFARQVEQASGQGFAHIEAHAARYATDGSSYFNGYYTWPRLGYDQSFDDFDTRGKPARVLARAQKAFPEAESVADLMRTKEGRDWWKEHGIDLEHARFDLADGSHSRRVLDAYLEELELKKAAGKKTWEWSGKTKGEEEPEREPREEIDLSEEQEAALDAAWERIAREDEEAAETKDKAFLPDVKASFFADCQRDDEGHCKPGTGGGSQAGNEARPAKKEPAEKEPAEKPTGSSKKERDAPSPAAGAGKVSTLNAGLKGLHPRTRQGLIARATTAAAKVVVKVKDTMQRLSARVGWDNLYEDVLDTIPDTQRIFYASGKGQPPPLAGIGIPLSPGQCCAIGSYVLAKAWLGVRKAVTGKALESNRPEREDLIDLTTEIYAALHKAVPELGKAPDRQQVAELLDDLAAKCGAMPAKCGAMPAMSAVDTSAGGAFVGGGRLRSSPSLARNEYTLSDRPERRIRRKRKPRA